MPSGRTHDSITLWSLPVLAGTAFSLTGSGNLTLLVCGAFLFSGLMFGPDLDIYSQQYKRWGAVRWIWLPYRNSMRHRSALSHGMIIGTIGRLVYLGLWIAMSVVVFVVIGAIAGQILSAGQPWEARSQQTLATLTQQFIQRLQQHPQECFAIVLGCELGAMSHSLSDWIGSAIKRWKKRRQPGRKR